MAKSKFEYVKHFEQDDYCLPNCWIVVRVDGRNFHRFSKEHDFSKPNDVSALGLMNKCAEKVMEEFKDIIISLGHSDEYSFVFRKETEEFQRRKSKLESTVVSCFTGSYVFYWKEFFEDKPLLYPPTFDSRTVVYPSNENVRDYLSWRQADCHINNLHNTCFWKLVLESGMSPKEAQTKLGAMVSSGKNELLFSQYNTNYNNLPEMFRKGTVLVREPVDKSNNSSKSYGKKNIISILHCDIIKDDFWNERPFLLNNKHKA